MSAVKECRSGVATNRERPAEPFLRDQLHRLEELIEHRRVLHDQLDRVIDGLIVDDLDAESDVPRVLGPDDDANGSRALEPALEEVSRLHPQTLQDKVRIPVSPVLVLGAGGCGDGHVNGHVAS